MTDAAALALDEETTDLVNSAFESGRPILIAYVNAEGEAHLSYRGSTHVHSADQLAIWVRDPDGGLLKAIDTNPKLTLMFRNPENRTQIFFYGRGHVENDDATRARVFDESPEGERNRDPERKGMPLVVDLDKVQGGAPGARIDMVRA